MAHSVAEVDILENGAGVGSAGGSAYQVVQWLAMRGEVDTAVQLYEDLSAAQRERLLREASAASVEERKGLVEVLRRARDFIGAARLLQGSGSEAEAASLYEQGGSQVEAAEAYLRSGDIARAAEALERGGALERALELYRGLGARESMAQCLARLGRPLEAAAVYRELGNVHAEVEALCGVPVDDAKHLESVLRICTLLDNEGQTRRALALLVDTLRGSEDARSDPAVLAEQARLLKRVGRDTEANEVLARLPGVGPQLSSVPQVARTPSAPSGYGYLKAIPIFGELALDDMKDLYRVAQQVLIPEGATVLEKGTQGSGLFVLLEGTVDVFSGPEQDAKRLNTLGPGAHLGEISLIQDGVTSAQVRARTAVRALRITRAGFQHYLDTHDSAALRIYRLFTRNLAARVRALST
ncbi:cyclic nucleotide-binding domain-containing protein [Stigmatella sp. ncwal1]|uniref:Cyclic nucleotide-binding domain-containing protein n=1 Tax=Stigmatella ashevillensis TaxID=2995309 RepID=A0ABT5DJT3_9BACT|nr:cyclic nucleotide-binding domain-containing protein [Stigmatella ashevillena]MDC0712607.1 cyclic nucleotide-binding domain-containing protein [Stigmatella ashevillena]